MNFFFNFLTFKKIWENYVNFMINHIFDNDGHLRLYTKLLIYPFCRTGKWGTDDNGSYGISGKMAAVF